MEVQNLRRAARGGCFTNCCWTKPYPVPHQVGQGNNGSRDFTDPVYIVNNAQMPAFPQQGQGNPSYADFNPDQCNGGPAVSPNYLNTANPPGNVVFCADSSCAKPGFVKFQYPHPLVGGSGQSVPKVRATH